MLAYWRGRFYLECLSGPRGEREAPCPASLTTSSDGVRWKPPWTVFPAIAPTNRLRQPLAVMVGSDGETFDELLTIHGRHTRAAPG